MYGNKVVLKLYDFISGFIS